MVRPSSLIVITFTLAGCKLTPEAQATDKYLFLLEQEAPREEVCRVVRHGLNIAADKQDAGLYAIWRERQRASCAKKLR